MVEVTTNKVIFMKQKYLYILSIFSAILFSACNENEIISPDGTSEAVELMGIQAIIADGNGTVTRADNNTTVLSDHIGRYQDFVNGDKLVFTSIRRTTSPIDIFNYNGIVYNVGEGGSLARDKDKGSTAAASNGNTDKIYWSDAKSGHTFIGYSEPQQPTDAKAFDWNKSGTTYYGSLGDPTEAGNINYNNTLNGNQLITNDDILLTWDDSQVADNAVAYITFYHGLALIRVQVSLSGFAPDEDMDDVQAVASNMIFIGMPTMYKWDQVQDKEHNHVGHATQALVEGDQTALNSFDWGKDASDQNNPAPAYDQKKNVQFWCPRPTGDSPGKNNNKFTFYALAVPRTGVDGQEVEFTVTYPNPMKPTETGNHPYKATLPDGIEFRAGYCTTITIHLDHKNEKITIGAEYIDWEYDPHPDDGSLKKNSTFLKSVDMTKVTTADETGVTIDNATWLFKGTSTNTIYDIYMNDGSAATPYQIRTADQLLSFAKEVNSGRTFEGKYISLDAGLYLQASTTDTGLVWPGIGTSEHPFQGTFLGGMRRISRLQGHSLFGCIGANGNVEQIMLEDVISISDGRGALADINNGIISACKVESRLDKKLIINSSLTTIVDYAGALCGVNGGMIVGCYALGNFCAYATTIGGLVGKNTGSVVASYSAVQNYTVTQLTSNEDGVDGANKTAPTTVGGVVGDGSCTYCFYCNETISSTRDSDPATGMTTTNMQKDSFVGSAEATNVDTSTLNGAIHKWCLTGTDADAWPAGFSKDAEYSPAVTDGNGQVVTQAVTLANHLNQIRYMSRVASFPIFYSK